jgi:hypothetical protein
MIYVSPNVPRGLVMRYVMWLPVLLQTWVLHPKLGFAYATTWANASLRPLSALN